MGCDGGTIPKRDELVKTKQKREENDKNIELLAKWQLCAISSHKLIEPIMSCDLGRLYNKEAVIEYLLDKTSTPNAMLCKHIRSMRDVITLNLTKKSNYNDKKVEIDGQYVDTHDSQFICPVVGLDMNGKYKFCYLRSCGCVLSERALKEVKSETCHKCNKEFTDEDIIVINGNDTEIQFLKKRMNERRNKAKEEKKSKKRKASETETSDDLRSNKLKAEQTSSSSSTSGTTSSMTTKTSSSSLLTEKASKDYSVANDPNASEVYKSIFTTHKTAKNQQKAHWVTFNPCYY